MHEDRISPKKQIRNKAVEEWENVLVTLEDNGIRVFPYEDTEYPEKPDAVFSRDWNSFHDNGTLILYPLKCSNRQIERRMDVIEKIAKEFEIKEIFSLADEEKNQKFLEGSGAIVFDHVNGIMYVCKSQRTNEELVHKVAEKLGFKPIIFEAVDKDKNPVYHADVVITIGSEWAVVCKEAFKYEEQLKLVEESLKSTEHDIISITRDQMACFAANCYEAVNNKGEKFIIMSQTAFNSYEKDQIKKLESYAKPLPCDIHTIESIGGGSIRCMSGDIRVPLLEKSFQQ